MRRNFDIIRQILLECEQSPDEIIWISELGGDEDGIYFGYSDAIKAAHFRLLLEANLVAEETIAQDGNGRYGFRLTWAGYDFLDSVRDRDVWQRTKAAVTETGGSATLDIVKQLAVGFLKQKIEKHTDVKF